MDLRALAAPFVAVGWLGCTAAPPPPPDDAAGSNPSGTGRSFAYPDHGAAGQRLPPADSLRNPFAGAAEAATAGQRLFTAMNCDGCHGEAALGFAAPSLVDGRWRYGGADGALFQSIYYGRSRGMPAYGGLLSDDPIWQLVSYLKQQPITPETSTTAWP